MKINKSEGKRRTRYSEDLLEGADGVDNHSRIIVTKELVELVHNARV